MSSGRILVIDPLKARPIGERAVATITASGIAGSLPKTDGLPDSSLTPTLRRAAPSGGGDVPPGGAGQISGAFQCVVVLPRRGPRQRLVEVVAAGVEHGREIPADRRVQGVAEGPVNPGEERLLQPGPLPQARR